ncbi:MAG: hypothetical protein DRN04_02660 [Thermoprotei archaeon]|nr:MAG: hypothetical protein DRN04_02660 [Thermoprotei archaeon]
MPVQIEISERMLIEGFKLTFIGHASFLVEIEDKKILLDPFFAEKFWWKNHYEHRITPLRVKLEELPCPKIILITHDHGDHFDIEAVLKISSRCNGVLVYSTKSVVDQLTRKGVENCFTVERNHPIRLNRVKIVPIQNEEESPDKYSFLIESNNRKLFYSGDCHKVPPDLPKATDTIDVLIIWPVEKVLEDFLKTFTINNIVLMHYDKFKPGDFICNINPKEFKNRFAQKYPKVNIIIPE